MRRRDAEGQRALAVGHGERDEAPGVEERVDGQLGALDELLAQRLAVARGLLSARDDRSEVSARLDDLEPALALGRRGLDDDARAGGQSRARPRSRPGCGTPSRSNARRCSRLSVARAAVAGSMGCGRPSAAATSAATRTGPSVPGEIRPPARSRRARPAMASASIAEMGSKRSTSPSRTQNAAGSRSHAIVSTPSRRAAA